MKKISWEIRILLVLVCIKAVVFYALQHSGIGLMPDEAQYWTWSKVLSYGYYSKPPGVAWQIAVGTFFFGDTEFGVRLLAFFWSIALCFSIYFLAKRSGFEKKRAFWTSVAFAVTPISTVSTCLATTDCGFLTMSTFALGVVARPLLERKNVPLFTFALLIAIGALFKWTAFLFWLPLFFFIVIDSKQVGKAVLALLFSLIIGLLPSILWNIQHDWATFRHVFHSVSPDRGGAGGNPLEFLGAQFALVSPIFFFFMLAAWLSSISLIKKLPRSILLSYAVSFSLFLLVFILSFFKRVQGNWAIAAYPTAFVFLFAWVAMKEKPFKKWLVFGGVLAAFLSALIFLSPSFLPYKTNFCRQGLGWQGLEKGLRDAGYRPGKDFLFSDRYQTVSILSFYGPEKKMAYFMNFHKIRKNQFSYWPQAKEQEKGKAGYYVTVIDGSTGVLQKALYMQRSMKGFLYDYFDDVSGPLMVIPLIQEHGQAVKVALVMRCIGYNGRMPEEVSKY